MLEVGVYGFIFRANFQVTWVLHIKIHETALAADAGLQGDTFLDTVVLPDHHDQLFVPAGPQANFSLEDAFFTAFAAGILIAGHVEAPLIKGY